MTDRSDSELLVHLLDERDAAELDDGTRDALHQRVQQAPDAAAQLETMQRVSNLLDAATTEADSPPEPGHPKLSPERRTALLAHHRAWAKREAAPDATRHGKPLRFPPRGGAMGWLGVAAMLFLSTAALLLPHHGPSADALSASQIQAETQLRAVHAAVQRYVQDYRIEWPPDLASMVRGQYLRPEHLVGSPERQANAATDRLEPAVLDSFAQLSPHQQQRWVAEHSAVTLLGPAPEITDPASRTHPGHRPSPVALLRPEASQPHVALLLADRQVLWLRPDELDRHLDTQR